jgi:hypothetical protein
LSLVVVAVDPKAKGRKKNGSHGREEEEDGRGAKKNQ